MDAGFQSNVFSAIVYDHTIFFFFAYVACLINRFVNIEPALNPGNT